MTPKPILLFGQFRGGDLSMIEAAAEHAACTLTRADAIEEAIGWLDGNEALGVLCHSLDSEQLAVQTRARARLAKLPLLSLSDSLSDLDFASAFSWGADDLVPLGVLRPLVTRLRALPNEQPAPPSGTRGTALVAEGDQTRRITLARVLRNAGFAVRFAVTVEDARRFSIDPALALIVTSKALMPDMARTIQVARTEGSQANFVVCSPPRELRADRATISHLRGVTVTDSFAPPENVLFDANELGGGRSNSRHSPRVAYGTHASFRGAGRDVDEHGFSYNVSEKGLYIRTLAPPEDDEVWLELCPPLSERRVRLVGKVAWRRAFNYSESATVPPGFGVSIVDGAARDISLWVEGYRRLVDAVG